MPLIAKDSGGKDFKKVPSGTHIAVCNLVCDVGVQPGGKFKPQRKVYIRWEVPAERVEYEKDGKHFEGPLSIGKFYTLSLSEKATLRRDLENWRGKGFTKAELDGFDLFTVLGAACQIVVTHSEGADSKTYANVTGVMGLPRGVARPKAENDLIRFSHDEPEQYESLPNWLKEKIGVAAPATDVVTTPNGRDDDFDDEIPF